VCLVKTYLQSVTIEFCCVCNNRDDWYGMLSSWADNKKKSNLVLSLFEPGNIFVRFQRVQRGNFVISANLAVFDNVVSENGLKELSFMSTSSQHVLMSRISQLLNCFAYILCHYIFNGRDRRSALARQHPTVGSTVRLYRDSVWRG
jgi:hypothetical protein